MKFTFNSYTYEPDRLEELYEQDSSYYPLIEFVRKWQRGDHTFEFQSSGSTGTPKKISIYRKQIEASIANTAQFLDLKKNENILLCLNPGYIAAIMMVARGLVLDMDIHIIKPSANPLSAPRKDPFDFASFVPFQMYNMLKAGNLEALTKIRNVLIGGAPLSEAAFNQLAALPNNFYQTYGMTETVSHIGLMKIQGSFQEAQFQLLPNIFIGTNQKGCLWIDGDITNNSRIQTSDVVEITDDTNFKWLGRNDNVINSGGIKIHPEQIENIIRIEFQRLQLSNEFFVSGTEDSELGQQLVLIIEGAEIDLDILAEIKGAIQSQLSKYHVPKQIEYLAAFARTESGKIKRA